MVLNDEVIIYKNIFRFGKYLKSESYKDLVEELGILKVTNIYYIQGRVIGGEGGGEAGLRSLPIGK